MQRVQRKFGLFLKRTPNENDIATMLHEFEESDQMLGKVSVLIFVLAGSNTS